MSDITLVNLSYRFKEQREPGSPVPLGCLYLVSALEEKGYAVDFKDYPLDSRDRSLSIDSLVSFLSASSDVLGVSCCSDSLPTALAALKKVKAEAPQKYIILGGVGPTGTAAEILRNFPFIDVIVKGEGEKTIVEIMDRHRSGIGEPPAINGIAYHTQEGVYLNPPRERIKDLDKISLPAYHKINPAAYSNLGLVTARGCLYRCDFCDAAPFWHNQVIRRDIEKIIRELKTFHVHYPHQTVQLYDETFTMDKKRVLRFCRRLKEENLDLRWSVMTRIDLVDKELMKEMSAAGCCTVLYGMESGSDRLLHKMGKKYNTREAKEKILHSLDYFQVLTPVIWGFPFETTADFYETMEFAASVSEMGAVPLLNLLTPFSLSPLYAKYKDTLKFSRELYEACHLIQDEEVIGLIAKHPHIFPGSCYYEESNVPEKYPIAKGYENPVSAINLYTGSFPGNC
ncbi:MAG TPA: radical SAM protein [Candidatus Deferrimicrobium sp.]|nr:radical SAM protein [Candidatus Deferrimicrobium sp.]